MTPSNRKNYSMKKEVLRILMLLAVGSVLVSMSIDRPDTQEPWPVPEKYQDMKNPYAAKKDYDDIGRTLYSQYCSTCHGNGGKGDGINAQLIKTPVADFTMDDFKSQSEGSMYYKIVTGRNEMPGFEQIIPVKQDLWMVVKYVKEL